MKTFKNHFASALGGLAVAAGMLIPVVGSAAPPGAKSYVLYVGGYTRAAGKGIYAYRFEPTTGDVAPMGLMQEGANPSWIAEDPSHRFLYAVNEHPANNAPGTGDSITAYARNAQNGRLTLLNTISSQGTGPAHLSVDMTGKTLAVANFGAASIVTFPIKKDGSLGPATGIVVEEGTAPGPSVAKDINGLSPTDSHVHCATISPDNGFVLSCNLGIGQISAYRFNAATGALQPNGSRFRPPSLADHAWRPRHLVFDPTGKYVYILDISMHVTVAAFDVSSGRLTEIQTVPIVTDSPPAQTLSASEIITDRSGRFVYTSARPVDAIHKSVGLEGIINVFAVDPRTHALKPLQHLTTHGDSPRSFALDPSGAYLFAGNMNSGSISVFAVDRTTGLLSPTDKLLKETPEPTAFVFAAMK